MMNRQDLLSARVPRYTSYPTAPHFTAAVNGDVYGDMLAALPDGAPISLYVHIPFCDTLCWFCGCHTAVVNHYQPVAEYLKLVEAEIDLLARRMGQSHPISHLHWGGGSPTILSPEHILQLTALLKTRFGFTPGAEFAVEIDPRDLREDQIAALAEAGLTRASIGVQDESVKVQRAINRIQPHAVTKSVVDSLRAHGVNDINIDLIYGLPHQGLAELADTIDQTLTLKPSRFAVFGFAYLPKFKAHMKLIPPETLPDADVRLASFDLAHEKLCAAGYLPIGLDHFALPEDGLAVAQKAGRLMRNFQGYTDDPCEILIGLGASSIGQLPGGYVQNFAPVPEYRARIEAGTFATARGVPLSDDDKLRRNIIERLMCDLSVDLEKEAVRFSALKADFAIELAALAPLVEAGFAEVSGAKIRVPQEARFGVRLVAASFDRYLGLGKAVHAVAV